MGSAAFELTVSAMLRKFIKQLQNSWGIASAAMRGLPSANKSHFRKPPLERRRIKADSVQLLFNLLGRTGSHRVA